MANETRSTGKSGVSSNITDGGGNTAADVRGELDDLWDSVATQKDENTFETSQNVTTLRTKSGPWVDVTHPGFGAKGDGATDDTQAIIDAETAAAAAGATGLWFPPGTYMTDQYTPSNDNLTYAGPGFGASTIKLNDGASASILVRVSFQDNITFKGLTLHGNRANVASSGGTDGLVEVVRATNITFRYCRIREAADWGVYGFRSDDLQICNNVFDECASDVRILYSDGNSEEGALIHGNECRHASKASNRGIRVDNGGRGVVTITNNKVFDAGKHEISGVDYTQGTTGLCYQIYGDRVVFQGNHGIRPRWSSAVLSGGMMSSPISGNYFECGKHGGTGSGASSSRAVWIEGSDTEMVSFTGNVLDGALTIGSSGGGDRMSVTGNTIRPDQDTNGISSEGVFIEGVISNNTVVIDVSSTASGIRLFEHFDSSSAVTINGNAISGFSTGILFEGSGTVYGHAVVGNALNNNTTPIATSSGCSLDSSVTVSGNSPNDTVS